MQLIRAAFRVLLFLAAGSLLGWYFGDALIGGAVAALTLLLFWSYQTWRLQLWLEDSSEALPDIHGVWGDIIARIYKQQREAAETEKRLQSTVDYLLESFAAMRDGVVIVEGHGGIRWSNKAARTLLGLRYPDDIGRAITNLVRVPEFNEYINAGNYTEPLVFATLGENPLHLQLVVTRFAEGDTLLFVRDVTERIRTERIRRDFVGNVSHELRTPLTVITGYLGTFLSEPDSLSAPQRRAFDQMAGQAERMENLLKDLLWLSRIESAERREQQEMVDMAALLDELRYELSNTHPDNVLELDIGCRDKVLGNYRELYSAVSNLVFNAFRYSPEGSPVIASWRKVEDDCQLAVKDQGIGIDPMHFPRLTERFYRVDESRSSATGGTGLGLAIVKHVAAAHGAQLKIDSRMGQGSTFTLVFPATA